MGRAESQRGRLRARLRCALAIAAALVATTATAVTRDCANGVVRVEAATGERARKMCTHADTALAQFEACALPAPRDLEIQSSATLPEGCMGVFHCGTNRIDVLSPELLAQRRSKEGLFAHIPTDRYFGSIIVHEMAHALYDPVPCPYGSCLATSEYFAYTHQIASLDDVDRKPIENAWPEGVRARRDAISGILLQMAPNRFARNAWMHFSQRPDGCAQWQAIMDAIVVFDTPRP